MAKEKATEKAKIGGIATHIGVLFQTLSTWALALDFLKIDPKTLALLYEPPTGDDMLFTLEGGNDVVYCQAKYRGKAPSPGEIKKWFLELHKNHKDELESSDANITLLVVTTLELGSDLYRAVANIRHRPSYLRGKLKITEEEVPFDCNLRLISLPSEPEAISMKTCWGLIGLLGIPLSSQDVQQVLSNAADEMVKERHASGGKLESVQDLIINPLFNIPSRIRLRKLAEEEFPASPRSWVR